MIVTPNESDIFKALRLFLKNVLPNDVEVVQTQDNRVPEPKADNWVEMTPLRMPRLSTNREALASLGLAATFTQSSQCVMQVDVHGPQGANNAQIISTMFRSSYAVDFFKAQNPNISPLFADDPRQMPFVNGENQYEDRWVVEPNMQVNQTVTATAESARALELGITDIETDPASWPNSVVTAP